MLLAEAVEAYRATLRVRTEADHPVPWTMTTENLGVAHEAMEEHPTCADPQRELARAADCFEAALGVFDTEHMSFNHQKASAALELVRWKLGDSG